MVSDGWTEWTDGRTHARTTPKLYPFDFVGGTIISLFGPQLDYWANEKSCSTSRGYFSLAGGDFSHLLITFANSLAPDQDRSRSKRFGTRLMMFLKDFFLNKVYFEKVSRRHQKHEHLSSMQIDKGL